MSPYVASNGEPVALLPICIGFVCGVLIGSWWSIATVPALYTTGFLIAAILSVLFDGVSWDEVLAVHPGLILFPLFIYFLNLVEMFVPIVLGTLLSMGIQRARS